MRSDLDKKETEPWETEGLIATKERISFKGFPYLGFILGSLLAVAFTIIAFWTASTKGSVGSFFQLLLKSPEWWFVYTFPLLFGLTGFAVKRRFEQMTQANRSLVDSFMFEAKWSHSVKRKIETIFESMPDAMLILDNDGVIQEYSAAALRTLGFEENELIGQSAAVIFGEEGVKDILLNNPNDIFEGGFVRDLEVEFETSYGHSVFLKVSTSYIWDDNSKQQGIVCVAKDISELKESETKFSSIFRNASDAIICTDASSTVMMWNQAASHLFGYCEAEMIGENISRLMTEQSTAQQKAAFKHLFASSSGIYHDPIELVGLHKDGMEIDLELTLADWEAKNETFVLAIFRDIAIRKQMETVLIKAKEEYESLFNNAPIPILVARDDRIVFHNSELESRFGYSSQEIDQLSLIEMVHPKDLRVISDIGLLIKKGHLNKDLPTFRIITKSGETRWVNIETTPFMWENKRSLLVFIIDNTERLAMERALRESEEQFRSLVQSLNVIIMKVDHQLNFSFINDFGLEYFGYSDEELLGKSLMDTIIPEAENQERDLNAILEKMVNSPEKLIDYENENIRRNGERVWVNWRNQAVFNDQGKLVELLSIGYDTTERRQAQEKIRAQQEKIESAFLQMTNELEQARQVQIAMLPKHLPSLPEIDLAVKYFPMDQIGGDFYDLYKDESGNIGILVGDVTGHGIPAALLSFMFLTTFKKNRTVLGSMDEVVGLSNSFLVEKLPKGKYATVFCCEYNHRNQSLTYCSAGHPHGILIRHQTEEIIQLQTKGMVVGMFKHPVLPYQTKTIELLPGDKVLVYTDGITEVSNAMNQMMEESDLEAFLLSHRELEIDALLDELLSYCSVFSGSSGFADDITVVGIELKKHGNVKTDI